MFLGQTFFGKARNPRCRSILLQTALPAAVAGDGFMGINGNMANLAASPVCPGHNLAMEDDAAANACTQRHHDKVLAAFAAALPHLAQCSYIRIVSGLYGNAFHQGLHFLWHIYILPAQVYAHGHKAIAIHRPRNADSDSFDFFLGDPLLLQFLQEGCRNVWEDVCSLCAGIRRDFPLIHHLPCRLKQANLAGSTSNVYTKAVFLHILMLLSSLLYSVTDAFIVPYYGETYKQNITAKLP